MCRACLRTNESTAQVASGGVTWRQAVSPQQQVASGGVTKAADRFGFPEHADSTARVPRKRRTAARGPRCTWLAVDASTAAWAASTQDTRDGRHQARMTDNAACPSSRSAVSSLAPSAPRDRWPSCSGVVFEPASVGIQLATTYWSVVL